MALLHLRGRKIYSLTSVVTLNSTPLSWTFTGKSGIRLVPIHGTRNPNAVTQFCDARLQNHTNGAAVCNAKCWQDVQALTIDQAGEGEKNSVTRQSSIMVQEHAIVLYGAIAAMLGNFGPTMQIDEERTAAARVKNELDSERLEAADLAAQTTGDGAVYGQLIVLGYRE